MESKLTTKKLKLKLITPVVIGSGETLDGYEYIIYSEKNSKQAKTFLIDLFKLLKAIDPTKQNKLLSTLEKNIMKFRKELQNHKELILDKKLYTNTIEVTKPVWDLIKKQLQDSSSKQENQLLIALVPRVLKKPFIPGSSVKGAIRTAFCALNRNAQKEKEALNYSDPFDDPFRSLKVSDSVEPLPTYIVKVNVFNNKNGQWQNLEKLTLLKEAFKRSNNSQEVTTTFLITFNHYGEGKENSFKKGITEEHIKKLCKQFYQKAFETDENYFNSGSNINRPYIADYLVNELKEAFKEDSPTFPLRVGWGSGALSIGVRLFNYSATVPAPRGKTKNTHPTSRRLVVSGSKFLPLGWAVAWFEDE